MPFPNMRQDSTIKIHEGESITLMCSFNITKNFYNKPYVVYWMKTSSKSSEVTCVYSYSYSDNKMSHYNYHCPSSKSLLNRVSNNTLDKPNENIHSHNLIINKSTHLDSGQYACALNVIKGNRGNWAVLNNITMSVDKKEPSDPGTTRKTTFVMAANPTQTVDQPLSEPHGSPYLVSGRELEPYSVVQLAAPPADSVERDQSELSAEPYSIVMQNSLYEASGPSQGDKDSSKPRTEHLAGNMKQPEGAVDTGAHVYEVIKDTNSTC
ncbi:hypothetical protein JZ751_020595 [Albula glossodonta]|uniref:Ig-like domain-containing protein n=1 Tax=Albula glossodonta TaxID=121402 RepID=A0A8T2PMY0_9TELE|nr:hypothetical protein JZ751_020595 [Albula glossodonta]